MPEETPPPSPKKWPKWRVLMLIGALILLAIAVLDTALDDDLPRWLYVGTYAVGYVFLAYGFFSAMNARSGRSSPRDRG